MSGTGGQAQGDTAGCPRAVPGQLLCGTITAARCPRSPFAPSLWVGSSVFRLSADADLFMTTYAVSPPHPGSVNPGGGGGLQTVLPLQKISPATLARPKSSIYLDLPSLTVKCGCAIDFESLQACTPDNGKRPKSIIYLLTSRHSTVMVQGCDRLLSHLKLNFFTLCDTPDTCDRSDRRLATSRILTPAWAVF